MPELTTPTARFVAVLGALAAHLTAHPHLPPVGVPGCYAHFANARHLLQIAVARYRLDELHAVIAWAESLAVTEATVLRFPDEHDLLTRVHVHIRGDLDGHLVEVWSSVPALDGSTLTDGQVVRVDELLPAAARAAADSVLAGAR